MKTMDVFCSSQAATAICSSMAEISPASSSAPVIHLGGGGRAIDRFNPMITDSRRQTAPLRKPPLPSQQSDTKPAKKENDIKENKKKNKNKQKKGDSQTPSGTRGGGGGGWRCTEPGNFVTPQSSSRYLLNDEKESFLYVESGFDPIMKLEDPNRTGMARQASSSSSSSSHPQSGHSGGPTDKVVVVLRVSLHCKGCEKKMRKHISRMQGVSSFNIDFVAKKVTVIGDVTPLGVLASISKVKTAQLWPSPTNVVCRV